MHPMRPLRRPVLDGGPGHRLAQPGGGERLEVVQHRLDLRTGGPVVAVPGDHPSRVAPHLVAGVRQGGHLHRGAAQDLDVPAVDAGGVALAEQVLHGPGGGPGAVPAEGHHHGTLTTRSSTSSTSARASSAAGNQAVNTATTRSSSRPIATSCARSAR